MVHSLDSVRVLVLFAICCILAIPAFSQIDSFGADSSKMKSVDYDTSGYHDRFHVYIYPQVAIPLGELRQVIQNTYGNVGIGIAAGAMVNPMPRGRPSAFLIGIDFGYLIYGVDKIPANAIHGNIKSSFNVYSFGFSGRLMASQHKKFTPFLDGVLGAKIFNVTTKIDKNLIQTLANSDPEVIDSYDNSTLSYSVGVGFFNRKPGNDFGRGSFSVRFLYTWGMETRYVPRNSVYIDANNNVQYSTANTHTDMFLIQFGLMLY
jgi:hypothetical protein